MRLYYKRLLDLGLSSLKIYKDYRIGRRNDPSRRASRSGSPMPEHAQERLLDASEIKCQHCLLCHIIFVLYLLRAFEQFVEGLKHQHVSHHFKWTTQLWSLLKVLSDPVSSKSLRVLAVLDLLPRTEDFLEHLNV